MANNELSGPVLATCLAKWLQTQNNSYTYRFVFAPETIGPLVYLKDHLKHLREKTIAAFNLTCVGDNRAASFLPSRNGRTLTDRVARHIVEHLAPEHIEYRFIHDRASDERQYCSPGADLPMVSIMRTKYGNYPEYHTSLDDLSVICPEGLQKSFDIHKECIKLLEANRTYRTTITGEPQLSRSGLVVRHGGGTTPNALRFMIQNLLMYSDGTMDLLTIAEKMDIYAKKLFRVIEILLKEKLIREVQKNSLTF
jgi:aminopeptidase-like protein